ncbi:MAG: glycosyltransferase family 2 protein [Pseudomonadota bacterium]
MTKSAPHRMRATKGGPTVAAITICRNEERNLPGLFSNLSSCVDQIVIVDDFSSDRSSEIAAKADANVTFVTHAMDPEFGYAGQRNKGIEHAEAEWLIHMDCDERLSHGLSEEMHAAIKTTKFNAFRYRRLNHFLNRPMRHGGWASWNRPQLARKGAHRFEGKLHEAVVVEGGDALIGQLASQMIHLNEATFADRLEKSARYVTMTAERLEAEGVTATSTSIFARAAREFLKRYVLQSGFRDGTPGLISAMHSATSEFRAQALVWDKQNSTSRTALESELATAWPDCAQVDRQPTDPGR